MQTTHGKCIYNADMFRRISLIFLTAKIWLKFSNVVNTCTICPGNSNVHWLETAKLHAMVEALCCSGEIKAKVETKFS